MRRIKLSKTLKCETSNSQWRPRRRRQRHRWWPAPCHTELVHGRINNSDPIRILCLKQFRSLSHLHSYAQKTIFDTFWYASTPRCSWWWYPLTAFEKESRLLPNAVIFLSLHGLTPYTSKQFYIMGGSHKKNIADISTRRPPAVAAILGLVAEKCSRGRSSAHPPFLPFI